VHSFIPLLFLISAAAQTAQQPATQPEAKPLFTYQEVMIPVRDGIHLQTVILTPVDQQVPLPILFRRTPYGVPAKTYTEMPASAASNPKVFSNSPRKSISKTRTTPTKPPTPTTPSTGSSKMSPTITAK
jgi:hypothetical protein